MDDCLQPTADVETVDLAATKRPSMCSHLESIGDINKCVAPLRHRVLSLSTSWPAALVCTHSFARAGRVMQRQSCSRACRSSAAQRTAACRLNPSMSKHSMGLKATEFLDRNDAYNFFKPLDDLSVTGPTFTNVNDFRAMLLL